MATGDAGAAKGLRVIANTKDLKTGYDDLNKKADEIAAEIDRATAAEVLRVEKTYLKVQLADPGHLEGRVWISWV